MTTKSGHTRTCPECGRVLETVINRWRVEMWPVHKYGSWASRTIDYNQDRLREPGHHDNEVQCQNSAQSVN